MESDYRTKNVGGIWDSTDGIKRQMLELEKPNQNF